MKTSHITNKEMSNRVSAFKALTPLSIQKDANIPMEGRDVVYARQLLSVIGLDNLNNYYDRNLKTSRLKELEVNSKNSQNWKFIKCELSNKHRLFEIFRKYKPIKVINLAAQAGVRYSIENPAEYLNSNKQTPAMM